MSKLRELKDQILQEGVDGRIDEKDLALLKQHLPADGWIAAEDMQVLVELLSAARTVCPAFDEFFFPAFKRLLLADGQLSAMERLNILRLFSGGGADEAEKRFLGELRRELRDVPEEFDSFCTAALGGPARR